MDAIKELFKSPYWVIALVAGVLLIVLPCVEIGENWWRISTHSPTTYWLIGVGLGLLTVSVVSFGYTLISRRDRDLIAAEGEIPRSIVKKEKGRFWTTVNHCEVGVITGRIEELSHEKNTVIALPCNEYFDNCADHLNSALGAFTARVFEGQIDAFQSLIAKECHQHLTPKAEQEKAPGKLATSYGPGRCLLLINPLNRSLSLALVSTSIQRAGTGIYSRVAYLLEGIRELAARMGDARISEVVMPVFGGGHGGLTPQLAFAGTLLAVAEAARHGGQGHQMRKVTVVIFRPDNQTEAKISDLVIQRTLALIAHSG